jgi:KUP system potassium uptake protein
MVGTSVKDRNKIMSKSEYQKKTPLYSMMLAAAGIVYGDIGTSPLYAFKEALNPVHGIDPTPINVLGILSLLLWALILLVTVKYIAFVLRADNKGEGGTMALMALVQGVLRRKTHWVLSVGLFGLALLYGDGIITPAISVLSAVEGLTLVVPSISRPSIILITLCIIVVLFSVQRFGTARIGKLFGPITLLWFIVIGVAGLYNVILNPMILKAFNPWYAIVFMTQEHVWLSFVLLGTIVLAITGVEALYVDMGHFGVRPIRLTWLYLVMPCLMLNYLGQGALVLGQPSHAANSFFLLFPSWMMLPVVILATMATVIASQAMISGAFSMTQQAVQLGYSPRFEVQHTSAAHRGQIYLPRINMFLFIGVVILVLAFKSSSNLAAAYGVAVTGTVLITTCLITLVARYRWHWSWWKIVPLFGFFFIVDIAFFSANLLKVKDGGWMPLMLGAVIYLLMITWRDGQYLTHKRHGKQGERVSQFVERLTKEHVVRVPGQAVYMSRNIYHVPYALALNVKHNRVIHEHVFLTQVNILDVPRVPDEERLIVEHVGQGIVHVDIQYGFMQTPDVPQALALLKEHGVTINLNEISYILGREIIIATKEIKGMALWREKLFAFMARNGAAATHFYHLPADQVMEIARQVEI